MKRFLLIIFFILQIADIFSTNHVLAAGGWEANPAMAASMLYMGSWWWLPKLLLMSGVVLVMTRWPTHFIGIAVGVMGIVVINNIIQLGF